MYEKGYIQIYTGNGKGKTTASLGLALRASCDGERVFMLQFLKGQDYAELKAPEYLPNFTMKQFGLPHFVFGNPSEKDKELAREGLAQAEEVMTSGDYDLVILDELNNAVTMDLIDEEDVLALMDKKPDQVELVITGRYAPKSMIEKADLVTEMKEIKHYFHEGVPARKGIEY